MRSRILSYGVSFVLLSGVLSGCANTADRFGEEQLRVGSIEQIEEISIDSDARLGIGAVLGGVVGGLIGRQVGGGRGRDVATILGVLGGGYGGAKIEQNYNAPVRAQEIIVRMENRVLLEITQEYTPGLRVGDRVKILGSGQDARVSKF